jgi:hypothetical protein
MGRCGNAAGMAGAHDSRPSNRGAGPSSRGAGDRARGNKRSCKAEEQPDHKAAGTTRKEKKRIYYKIGVGNAPRPV